MTTNNKLNTFDSFNLISDNGAFKIFGINSKLSQKKYLGIYKNISFESDTKYFSKVKDMEMLADGTIQVKVGVFVRIDRIIKKEILVVSNNYKMEKDNENSVIEKYKGVYNIEKDSSVIKYRKQREEYLKIFNSKEPVQEKDMNDRIFCLIGLKKKIVKKFSDIPECVVVDILKNGCDEITDSLIDV